MWSSSSRVRTRAKAEAGRVCLWCALSIEKCALQGTSWCRWPKFQGLLTHAKALAFAHQSPLHRWVCAPFDGDGLHGCGARFPLDDESHSMLALIGLHQLEPTKARISAHQQKSVHQARCHGQDALKVVLALVGQVLGTRAKGQLQTIALSAQISG